MFQLESNRGDILIFSVLKIQKHSVIIHLWRYGKLPCSETPGQKGLTKNQEELNIKDEAKNTDNLKIENDAKNWDNLTNEDDNLQN